MTDFSNIKSLKFYANKVLPLSYDDSLSYYEVLCKVVTKLNEVIETTNGIPEFIKKFIETSELENTILLIYERLRKQIAKADEDSETATANYTKGQLIWVNSYLYKCIRDIYTGDRFVANSNIEAITAEEYINEVKSSLAEAITDEATERASEISRIEGLLAEETENREIAISSIQTFIEGEISDVETLIAEEVSARESAVSSLTSAISAEVSNREESESAIVELIEAETSDREEALEEIEERISALGYIAHISDLNEEDRTVANIQNLINEYDKIDFDADVNVGNSYLTIPSNKEIFSTNGSVIKGNSTIFIISGSTADADILLTFSKPNSGTFSGGELNTEQEYLIRSARNCLDNSIGFPDFMGFGTTNNTICYPTIFTKFSKIDGSNFVISDRTYGSFYQGNVFVFNPVKDVYIHDINIVSTSSTSGRNYATIQMDRCENVRIVNCIIEREYGYDVHMNLCVGCTVENSRISVNDTDVAEGQIYDDNAVALFGCYNCTVKNNTVIGSQPIDLSFNGTDRSCSAFCEVSGNSIYATITGLNTHPATYNCVITNNNIKTERAGISLRGSSHIVTKNIVEKLSNEYSANALSVINGCACMTFESNICKGFTACIYIVDSGDANNPYPTGGICYFNFINNTFIQCGHFIRFSLTTHTNLNIRINADGNTLLDTIDSTNNYYLIYVTGTGSATLALANITNLKLVRHSFYRAIFTNTGILSRFFIDAVCNFCSSYSKKYSGSGVVQASYMTLTGTGTDSGATGTALSAIPSL